MELTDLPPPAPYPKTLGLNPSPPPLDVYLSKVLELYQITLKNMEIWITISTYIRNHFK